MEHEPDPDPNAEQSDAKPTNQWKDYVRIAVKVVVGMVVLYLAAIVLVFGACLLG